MLLRLLRFYLRPYRNAIIFVVVLQLVQTLATLYLPTLNAEIIDNGVDHRQHRLHHADRRGHDRRDPRADRRPSGRVYFGARTAMAMGRDVRASRVPPGSRTSPPAKWARFGRRR